MSNVLSAEKREQVVALGRLGGRCDGSSRPGVCAAKRPAPTWRAAGVAVRPPGGWGRLPAKPAKEVSTDPGPGDVKNPPPERSPRASACGPYRELIEAGLGRGRNAKFQEASRGTGRRPTVR